MFEGTLLHDGTILSLATGSGGRGIDSAKAKRSPLSPNFNT